MAVDPEPLPPDAPPEPSPFELPPPQSYKVARSAPGKEIWNTIDLFGEKPFSV